MKDFDLLEKLNELRKLPGETEVVEFKEAKNNFNFNDIGEYFSALSNEANLCGKKDAWLIFGIENKTRKIVGSNFRISNRQFLDSLKKEIADKTTNRISFIEIHELVLSEGRIVMFQIPAAPKGIPISWNGHYYGREGESLAPLTLEEIERIRDQATAADWSIEICADATIADLDTKAIQKARQNFAIKNPHLVSDIDDWDDVTFLNKSRLTINGKITRTAILLLGKHESEHFLSPSIAKITWLLKDKDNVEKDYVHYHCPFILAVDDVFAKIRNLKYRYMKSGTLFPDEVDQYAPYSIKESLSNCIAHQDYSLGGRITVTEREDGYLIFSNLGSFIPVTIENVIRRDSPPELYRNRFLAQAMVSLNMIDTIGSGIKRIFRLQRERYFPMPDYDLSDNKVTAVITGKVLDITYANTLARNPELTLEEIILLDKVSKRKELTETEIEHLKEKKLIEGRKPNFHISQKVAERIDKKADYIKNRGFKDDHYKKMIIDFIEKYGSCSKKDIDNLIFDILPSVLTEQQKKNKIRNLVYAMSMKDKLISNSSTKRNPKWVVMRK